MKLNIKNFTGQLLNGFRYRITPIEYKDGIITMSVDKYYPSLKNYLPVNYFSEHVRSDYKTTLHIILTRIEDEYGIELIKRENNNLKIA